MPEERHPPSQSSPPQHIFAQETRKTPSTQQQREASSSKTLPQSLIPHLPFWEQPSFQNTVIPTNKLSSAQHQQREDFSLSSQQKRAIPPSKTSIFPQAYHSQELQIQLQEALSSYNPPQKRQSLFSQDQTKPSSHSPQQIRHTQTSSPQPKKLHPLPSSKYIHPSPFDEIYEKYSLPNPVVIGKEGKFLYRQDPLISQNFRETSDQDKNLSSEEELEWIRQEEQEIEKQWARTSDPEEKNSAIPFTTQNLQGIVGRGGFPGGGQEGILFDKSDIHGKTPPLKRQPMYRSVSPKYVHLLGRIRSWRKITLSGVDYYEYIFRPYYRSDGLPLDDVIFRFDSSLHGGYHPNSYLFHNAYDYREQQVAALAALVALGPLSPIPGSFPSPTNLTIAFNNSWIEYYTDQLTPGNALGQSNIIQIALNVSVAPISAGTPSTPTAVGTPSILNGDTSILMAGWLGGPR